MEAIGIVITIFLMFFFFKKVCFELKSIFNRLSRYSTLSIIFIFSISFLGVDFGHQLYHNCCEIQHEEICGIHSEDNHTPELSDSNSALESKSDCPYCGILLKIATVPTNEALKISSTVIVNKSAIKDGILQDLTIFSTTRAPPIS